MGPVGRWLVPLFLLVVGAALIADGYALSANAAANLAVEQNSLCSGGTPGHSCATLAPCQEECGLAQITGILGGVILLAGVWMSGVRGWRFYLERSSRASSRGTR